MAHHGKFLTTILLLAFSAIVAYAQPPMLTNEWFINIRSTSDTTPAIAEDGTIYFGTFTGQLWAVNPDGTRKWTFTTWRGGRLGMEIKSSPAIGPDGTIYFGCRDRSLYALTPAGRKKWTFRTGGWVDSSPAIGADGTIYFGSCDRRFYALQPSGVKRWEFASGGDIVSSPAIGPDGTIFFGSHDRKLYALAPDGGKRWEFSTGGAILSSPAIGAEGTVYFTSIDGFFYALNPEGSLKWKLKTGGISESSPVIGQDGTLYVGVNEKLWAITPEGKMKWSRGFNLKWYDSFEATPLALADGTICFVSRYGLLVNLDEPNRWNWTYYLYGHAFASPAIDSNQVLYIRGMWTNFNAVRVTAPLAESSWPKFRADRKNTGVVRGTAP